MQVLPFYDDACIQLLIDVAELVNQYVSAPSQLVVASVNVRLRPHRGDMIAVQPGSRAGGYEITALLGRGEMGEVYRARDTKLGREVAIKILPNVWVTDPHRRVRVEREARVLASLNHPHIGAICGTEERSDFTAFVLELVEGASLADRLVRLEPSCSSAPRSGSASAPGQTPGYR